MFLLCEKSDIELAYQAINSKYIIETEINEVFKNIINTIKNGEII